MCPRASGAVINAAQCVDVGCLWGQMAWRVDINYPRLLLRWLIGLMNYDDELWSRKMSKTVCGHMCEGLQTFQDAANTVCIPRLDDDGRVDGCDDFNPVPLRYCPFCALSLRCPVCGEPNGHTNSVNFG